MQTTQRLAAVAAALSLALTGLFAYGTWDILPWWVFPVAFILCWSYLYNGWVKQAARENMANLSSR
jgi:hypothetical protein